MKKCYAALLAATLLISSNAFAQGADEVSAARAATERWAKLMDAEEYSAAWKESADSVRKDMPKLAWNMLMSAVHLPLGEFKQRSFQSASVQPQEISFDYLADYQKSHQVRERFTAVRGRDGVWRVSGYGINSDAQPAAK